MRGFILSVLAVVTGLLGVSQTQAEDFRLSEVRAGIFAHNVYNGFIPVMPGSWLGVGQIEDLNVELLFDLPDADFVHWIGSPRLNLGGTMNFAGWESMAHLGLTWTVPVFDTPFFVEGTFGGAVHNGYLRAAPPGYRWLGCRVNFYESASVGVNVTEQASVMLTYEHTSNLNACKFNQGLSNLGIRVGFKID